MGAENIDPIILSRYSVRAAEEAQKRRMLDRRTSTEIEAAKLRAKQRAADARIQSLSQRNAHYTQRRLEEARRQGITQAQRDMATGEIQLDIPKSRISSTRIEQILAQGGELDETHTILRDSRTGKVYKIVKEGNGIEAEEVSSSVNPSLVDTSPNQGEFNPQTRINTMGELPVINPNKSGGRYLLAGQMGDVQEVYGITPPEGDMGEDISFPFFAGNTETETALNNIIGLVNARLNGLVPITGDDVNRYIGLAEQLMTRAFDPSDTIEAEPVEELITRLQQLRGIIPGNNLPYMARGLRRGEQDTELRTEEDIRTLFEESISALEEQQKETHREINWQLPWLNQIESAIQAAGRLVKESTNPDEQAKAKALLDFLKASKAVRIPAFDISVIIANIGIKQETFGQIQANANAIDTPSMGTLMAEHEGLAAAYRFLEIAHARGFQKFSEIFNPEQSTLTSDGEKDVVAWIKQYNQSIDDGEFFGEKIGIKEGDNDFQASERLKSSAQAIVRVARAIRNGVECRELAFNGKRSWYGGGLNLSVQRTIGSEGVVKQFGNLAEIDIGRSDMMHDYGPWIEAVGGIEAWNNIIDQKDARSKFKIIMWEKLALAERNLCEVGLFVQLRLSLTGPGAAADSTAVTAALTDPNQVVDEFIGRSWRNQRTFERELNDQKKYYAHPRTELAKEKFIEDFKKHNNRKPTKKDIEHWKHETEHQLLADATEDANIRRRGNKKADGTREELYRGNILKKIIKRMPTELARQFIVGEESVVVDGEIRDNPQYAINPEFRKFIEQFCSQMYNDPSLSPEARERWGGAGVTFTQQKKRFFEVYNSLDNKIAFEQEVSFRKAKRLQDLQMKLAGSGRTLTDADRGEIVVRLSDAIEKGRGDVAVLQDFVQKVSNNIAFDKKVLGEILGNEISQVAAYDYTVFEQQGFQEASADLNNKIQVIQGRGDLSDEQKTAAIAKVQRTHITRGVNAEMLMMYSELGQFLNRGNIFDLLADSKAQIEFEDGHKKRSPLSGRKNRLYNLVESERDNPTELFNQIRVTRYGSETNIWRALATKYYGNSQWGDVATGMSIAKLLMDLPHNLASFDALFKAKGAMQDLQGGRGSEIEFMEQMINGILDLIRESPLISMFAQPLGGVSDFLVGSSKHRRHVGRSGIVISPGEARKLISQARAHEIIDAEAEKRIKAKHYLEEKWDALPLIELFLVAISLYIASTSVRTGFKSLAA